MKHIHPLPLLWIIHPASAGLCSIRFPLQRGGNHFPLIIVYQWPSWQLKLSVLLHWHEYIQYSEVLVSNPASPGCLTVSCRQVMWHERYRVILEDVTPTRSCRSNMHRQQTKRTNTNEGAQCVTRSICRTMNCRANNMMIIQTENEPLMRIFRFVML